MRKIDLTGQRFGRLFALEEMESERTPCGQLRRKYLCRCDCGAEVAVLSGHLSKGHTQSCGCYQKDKAYSHNIRHGHTSWRTQSSPTFNSWAHMIQRCTNPKNRGFKNYGGRGITVCDRWLESFENFLSDMGEKPKGKSLDRKNNNGNYEPGNCRWATPKEQGNNTRRNVYFEYQGQRKTLSQWARFFKIDSEILRRRLKKSPPDVVFPSLAYRP